MNAGLAALLWRQGSRPGALGVHVFTGGPRRPARVPYPGVARRTLRRTGWGMARMTLTEWQTRDQAPDQALAGPAGASPVTDCCDDVCSSCDETLAVVEETSVSTE